LTSSGCASAALAPAPADVVESRDAQDSAGGSARQATAQNTSTLGP
jgi:hypothetical protein